MKKLLPILLCVLLLLGCTTPHTPTTTPETVENIFTTPSTVAPGTTVPTGTEATEPTQPPYTNLGSMSFGLLRNDLYHSEEFGKYVVYQGGEMVLHLNFSIGGTIGNDGIGVLLLLDGIPQPYKTADSEEYAYLHTFYPPTDMGGLIVAEIRFVPVTGKAGDLLNLTLQSITQPDYRVTEEPGKPFRLSNGIMYETAFALEADPGLCPLPEITERISSLSISKADLTSLDTRGWSAAELQSKASFTTGCPKDSYNGNIYGITAEETVHFHAEIFSPGYVAWRLVVYIDNQPVTVLTENDIAFTVPAGQKVLIDMELNVPDFGGEMNLYAILVPRNSCAPEVFDSDCRCAYTSKPYYLLAANSYKEWLELIG